MKAFRLFIAATLALVTAVPSFAAADLAARDIIVPVVGRTPGAFGSMWQTDLVITNLTPRSLSTPVTIAFEGTSQAVASVTVDLGPRESLVLNDVVRNRFGLETATGYIRVTSAAPEARVTARARIYNRGSAVGEFGQSVAGLPAEALMKEHFIPALSGVGANRANVGVTNPWSVTVPVTFELIESDGNSRGSFTTALAPKSVRQINDIFHEFGVTPTEGAMARVLAGFPVYAYGSVVRNDSGDAVFVLGTGVAMGNERVVAPQCANPAPIILADPGVQAAPGWIVMYNANVDAVVTTQMLAGKHGFTPTTVYDAIKGFAAPLTAQQVAAIRCESSVRYVEENTVVPLP